MTVFLPFEENSYYEVSNEGIVRNARSGQELKSYLDHNGRVCVKLNGGGDARTCSVARAVYHAHVNSAINMADIRIDYADGNKSNVSPENLIGIPIAKRICGGKFPIKRVSDGRVFTSVAEAAHACGIHRSTIYRDLQGCNQYFKLADSAK